MGETVCVRMGLGDEKGMGCDEGGGEVVQRFEVDSLVSRSAPSEREKGLASALESGEKGEQNSL